MVETVAAPTPPIPEHTPTIETNTTPDIVPAPNTLLDATEILSSTPNGDHAGDLASLGLASWWTPVGWLQNLLEAVHVYVGLPWWGSIVVSAVIVRLLLIPLLLGSQVNAQQLLAIRPKLETFTTQLTEAKAIGDTQKAQKAALGIQKLLKDHDCHPLKSLVAPLVQLPVAIGFFYAIRNMCAIPVETLRTGGVLWFLDLTAADPWYVLPAASTAALLAMMQVLYVHRDPTVYVLKYMT